MRETGYLARFQSALCLSPAGFAHLVPTEPIFYIAACIAVTFLGLAKGGFAGVGLVATPLLSLVVPPVQAIAIVLPILLVQDVISVWAYRRHWDAWNLKVLIPGGLIGVAIAGYYIGKHLDRRVTEIRIAP
jgi:uncharacterized membrane protein YfcA